MKVGDRFLDAIEIIEVIKITEEAVHFVVIEGATPGYEFAYEHDSENLKSLISIYG